MVVKISGDVIDYGLLSFDVMTSNAKIKQVKVVGMTTITNSSYMFYRCGNLENIEFIEFDTSRITNMASMFSGCEKLQELNLENFDTKIIREVYALIKLFLPFI